MVEDLGIGNMIRRNPWLRYRFTFARVEEAMASVEESMASVPLHDRKSRGIHGFCGGSHGCWEGIHGFLAGLRFEGPRKPWIPDMLFGTTTVAQA